MLIEEVKTVGSIVAEDYRTAVVFKEYGIDFCCGGGRSLADTCASKGIPVAQISKELEAVQQQPAQVGGIDVSSWSLTLLSTYIEEKHHRYVRQMLPKIQEFALKVARVHGARHPETIDIWQTWEVLAADLSQHLLKEEQILFPYIREKSGSDGDAVKPPFGSVANPIRVMTSEHELAGTLMEKIRNLSNNFTAPEDACTTYRVLYSLLQDFESDLHQHIHLENNILFPKALELE